MKIEVKKSVEVMITLNEEEAVAICTLIDGMDVDEMVKYGRTTRHQGEVVVDVWSDLDEALKTANIIHD